MEILVQEVETCLEGFIYEVVCANLCSLEEISENLSWKLDKRGYHI